MRLVPYRDRLDMKSTENMDTSEKENNTTADQERDDKLQDEVVSLRDQLSTMWSQQDAA